MMQAQSGGRHNHLLPAMAFTPSDAKEARARRGTRPRAHVPARRRSPRRHHRRPGALVAALAGLALTVVAAAQTPKPAPPARIYAPPRQCYAFQSRSDIYLSCGTRVERITYRGDVGQFAISTDGRIFAFVAGWARPGKPELHVARRDERRAPDKRPPAWRWGDWLSTTCGTVVFEARTGGAHPAHVSKIDLGTATALRSWGDAYIYGCSDRGAASIRMERAAGVASVTAPGGRSSVLKEIEWIAISPNGRLIAYGPKGTAHGTVCVATVALPHVAACLAYSTGGPFTLQAAQRAGPPQEISEPGSGGVNDLGATLFSGDLTGSDSPKCYVVQQQGGYTGQLLSTRPKPGYVPMDAPCPALLYWKPGMPMAEILHPEMVPQYAQWVSPAAARRLRAWAARHRPKPKRKPR